MAKTTLESIALRPISRWFTREIRDLYTALESTYRTRTEILQWGTGTGALNAWCIQGGVPNANGLTTDLTFGAGSLSLVLNGVLHSAMAGAANVDIVQAALTAPGANFGPIGMLSARDSHIISDWTQTTGDVDAPFIGAADTVDITLVLMNTNLNALTPGPLPFVDGTPTDFFGILGVAGMPRANAAPATIPTGLQVKNTIGRIPAMANAAWCIAGSYNLQVTAGPVYAQTGFIPNFNNPANT